MYKVAVMGDMESIYGFAALGIDIFPVEDINEAKTTLKSLANNNFAIIYITEYLAANIQEEIDKYKDKYVPAIIPIPGISNNNGIGMKSVNSSVEKAVGSDILS